MEGYSVQAWGIQALFAGMRAHGLDSFAPDKVTEAFPDYLPPVVIDCEAEKKLYEAARAVAQCALPADALIACAYYQDHHDPAHCCVALSLQLRRPGFDGSFCVENSWLEEIGTIAQELLASSVALSLESAAGAFNFDFRLPVHRSAHIAVHHRDSILLVEDENFVRDASREVLETAGYRVFEAASAEAAQAIAIVKSRCLGLVISDLRLPGADGQQLATFLHARLPRLPVLLVSGYMNPAMENRNRRTFYLAKPYNADSLLTAVQRCLQINPDCGTELLPTASDTSLLLRSPEQSMPLAGA